MREDSGSVQYVEVVHNEETTARQPSNRDTNSMIPHEAEGLGDADSPSAKKYPLARYSSIHNSSGGVERGSEAGPTIKYDG